MLNGSARLPPINKDGPKPQPQPRPRYPSPAPGFWPLHRPLPRPHAPGPASAQASVWAPARAPAEAPAQDTVLLSALAPVPALDSPLAYGTVRGTRPRTRLLASTSDPAFYPAFTFAPAPFLTPSLSPDQPRPRPRPQTQLWPRP